MKLNIIYIIKSLPKLYLDHPYPNKERMFFMKIILVTQDDPFYSPLFIREFLKTNLSSVEAVIILPTLNQKDQNLYKLLMSFYGFWGFSKLGMEIMGAGIKNIFTKDATTESILKKNNIPYFHTNNINNPDAISKVKEISPDLIVSIGAPQIFKKEILSLPPKGCINIHESLLPEYKGVFPLFWQLLHGEKELGISVHVMDEKIDEGNIIRQTTFKPENMSFHQLMKIAYVKAANMLKDVLSDFDETKFKVPGSEGSYFSLPDAQSIRKFKQKGYRVI